MRSPSRAHGFAAVKRALVSPGDLSFAAIDFEIADQGLDSACSVGIVRVEQGVISGRIHRLIRPPRETFEFTRVHGITWRDVRAEPTFRELWPEVRVAVEGLDFVAAHNAEFDRSVLLACCHHESIESPGWTFLCTVELARAVWKIHPTKLPDVCRHLRIPLNHHDAASDAEACARIVLAASEAAARRTPRIRSSAPRERSMGAQR